MTRKSQENLKGTQGAILLNQEGLCEVLPKTIHEKEEEDELEEDDESLKEEIEEEEPLPTPIKKKKPKVVKRVMTEAQKENLVKARARVLELRKQVRENESKMKIVKVKKPTKLEKKLQDLKVQVNDSGIQETKEEPKTEMKEEPKTEMKEEPKEAPRPPTPHNKKKTGYRFVERNGLLFMEETELDA